MQNFGKIFILAGIIILILGIVFYFAGDKLSWFGGLPGDIKIKKENFSLFIPITTMLLISIALSILLWIIRKIFW
jgi:magnesium-transporting ATPase (P-type)